jgi:lipopolysaccharide export system permease protein
LGRLAADGVVVAVRAAAVLAADAAMTALDRYVGRIAAGAFLAALLFFLLLSIVGDLLNRLPGYVAEAEKHDLGGFDLAGYLGLYYLKTMPVLLTSVTPFATAIAGMMTVARLQHANEVVPMLFVGRSIQRVLRPLVWLGVFAALLMAASWQWVVPRVGAALTSEQALLRGGSSALKALVIERHDADRQQFYAYEFEPAERTLKNVGLLTQGTLAADTTLTLAPAAHWDDARGDWRLHGGRLRSAGGEKAAEWLGRPDLTPTVLIQEGRDTVDAELLSYTDLVALAETRPNRADVKLALHRHITFPLANLILLLLALPLAVFYERGSRISRVLGAIGLCGGYLFLDLICQSLGQSALGLHPIVAAWIPTIVFGSLGIVLFGSMRT